MALFNSFQFGDVDSKDYGVYISGDSVYDSPARSVDLVQVPGRNGALALDNGYYENIEVTYPAGSFGTSQEEWREKMLGIRNALAAQRGYQKLIDTYHPEHYRLGMFFAGISASPVQYNRAGQFPIRFNCKPQRFLTSGDEAVGFTAEGQEEVYGPDSIVSFEAKAGAEIRQLEVNLEPVQDLKGQASPWPAGGGKNLLNLAQFAVDYPSYCSYANDTLSVTNAAAVLYQTGIAVNIPAPATLSAILTDGTSSNVRFRLTFSDNTSINVYSNNLPYTTQKDIVAVKFDWLTAGTFTVKNAQIELGSTATSYAPYSNVCPISGRTEVNVTRAGKNLIKYRDDIEIPTTYNGISYSWGENGTIVLNGTASAVSYINITKADDPTPFRTGTEYHFKLFGAIEGITLPLRKDSTWIGSSDEYSYTFPEFDTAYLRLRIASGTVCNNLEVKPMVSLQTQWTGEYEPPAVATYPIPLGQTVYGGTLNVTTGALTINMAMVDLGTLNWFYNSASLYFSAIIADMENKYNYASDVTDIIMSIAKYKGAGVGWANMANGDFGVNAKDIRLKLTDYTSAAALVAAITGQQLVYPLATPTTVQLTPTQVSTLLGQNNIWADSGEVEVKVAAPVDLTNPTNFPAKPLIRVFGNGSVRVGDTIVTVQNNADGYVDINCESMNCYDTTGGRNADVSFSGNDFPELASGDNGILLTGPSKVEITPRWWEL